MSQLIEFDQAENVATLGGASMVLHCHFYNCTLQRAVEQGLGPAARDVLREAAVTSVRAQSTALAPKGASPSDVLAIASRLFSELGFGRFARRARRDGR